MHTERHLHPALSGLLQFEEQRLGVPIEAVKKALYNFSPAPAFRPVIEVRIHTGTRPESFPVLLADEQLEITAPAYVTTEAREVGFADATGQFCSLAGITDNRVTLFFDLNEVFYPGNVVRKPTNGTAPTGNPGNKVAALVFDQAFAIAVGNIRRYDWKKEQQAYLQSVYTAWQKSVTELTQNLHQNERSLEQMSWDIRTLARKNAEFRQQLRHHNLFTRKRLERKARDDHATLVRMLGRGLKSFRIDDGFLHASTFPISIEWHGTRYDMGQYVISIPIGDGRLRITSTDGSEVEGYSHPHIASDGAPCFGNIGGTVAQLLGEGEYCQVVVLMLEFLRSYNSDNPYLRIERWDPDWEDDEDRYESCYDNASLSDCATCNDWDCHHREGAERRCYEHSDTDDCISCGGCDHHRDAMNDCRDNQNCYECVTCTRECAFAGDVEACFDSHSGELCPDCPNTDCTHHEETDNED